jgi:4'-phosphopantetheinyl transferase
MTRGVHDVGGAIMTRKSSLPYAPVAVPHILPDAIHVWTFHLDIADWRDRLRPEWLSAEELASAGRFAFPALRRRFVVCRTTLRAILGSYLGRRPGELTFAQGPYGKPYLSAARARGRIRFNMSHSHELALVAISRQRELGVDLERVRPVAEIENIVARSFAPAERLAFDRVPRPERLATFYRYWTLKEACLKACGIGLSRALAEVDVSAAESQPLCLPDAAGVPRYWRVRALHLDPGYCGALVVEGRAGAVTTLGEWPPAALTLPDTPPKVGATTPHG